MQFCVVAERGDLDSVLSLLLHPGFSTYGLPGQLPERQLSAVSQLPMLMQKQAHLFCAVI